KADCIVTYGAAQSNHCRLTVSTANKLGFKTVLILAKSDSVSYNGNFLIYDLYGTEVVWTETNEVPETIEKTLNNLKNKGLHPYFIQGGGPGDLGTHAYKLAFDEIINQEKELNVDFDYICHASGTGTTQAGLVTGNAINNLDKKIIGISIARNEARGKEVIKESVSSYLRNFEENTKLSNSEITFIDQYV